MRKAFSSKDYGSTQNGSVRRKNCAQNHFLLFVIERARPDEAAALLDYLKIIGGETENLSFSAESVPLSLAEEQDYLRSQVVILVK